MDNKKTNFYQRLSIAGKDIPYGTVVSYGQLALLCGRPQHSRQVGYALKMLLAGESFPAHRVVNSQGYLSGAAAFSLPEQKGLLFLEGVEVNEENRVSLKKYGWKHTFKDALRLQGIFESMGI